MDLLAESQPVGSRFMRRFIAAERPGDLVSRGLQHEVDVDCPRVMHDTSDGRPDLSQHLSFNFKARMIYHGTHHLEQRFVLLEVLADGAGMLALSQVDSQVCAAPV